MSEKITVKLEDASRDQLLYFANTVKGLNLNKQMSAANIIVRIKQVHKLATIDVPKPGEPAEPAKPVLGPEALAKSPGKLSGPIEEPMVVMLIPETKEPGGNRGVMVIVNNKAIMLPRGKQFPVKYRYFENLKNAVSTGYEHERDDDGNIKFDQPLKATEVLAYFFNIVRMPPKAELLAWLKQEGARWDESIDKYYDGQLAAA